MPPADSTISLNASAGDLDQRGLSSRDTPELTWRVLQLLNLYRVLVAGFLLFLFFSIDSPRPVGAQNAPVFVATAVGYLLYGLLNTMAVRMRWPGIGIQVYAQVALDLTAIILLMHFSGGINSGLGNLLVVSIGALSLTVPRRTAFFFAALATLAILFDQALAQFSGTTSHADYTPTGVLGAIIFVIALAAQPLARRIQESEALARQRGVDLANLAELNEYIIQHLRESIVVVDGDNRIRLINESAAAHLGKVARRSIHLKDVSPKLLALVQSWRRGADADALASSSFLSADRSTLVNPHIAALGKGEPPALLIFLEDGSVLAERVQQSKLAALGRLSASIAHEIRNPMGAMSHAGQLLGESPTLGEEERRLTDIIHTNATRVSAIIENVLQLSRREAMRPEHLMLTTWLQDFVAEFGTTLQLPSGAVVMEPEPADLEVRMDPSHLHQVLWNLCENAVKYAKRGDDGEIVRLRPGRTRPGGRPFLDVLDRGPGIDTEAAERIFEPFFTGRHDGTGLGLFIARELCERNGAALLYEPRPEGGSCFRLIFADPRRWEV